MTRSLHARRFALGVTLVLTFSLLQAGSTSAQTLLVDDTRVNTAAGDPGDNTTQSETSLAVRGNTVCAGFNDSGPTNFSSYSGFARSTNRGQTWTDQGELGVGNSGDPTLAVNQGTGTFYYGENATIGGNSAIGVARSTDDCQSFGNAVDASAASSGLNTVGNITTLSDKPSIAVDNSGGANNGNVYVCWTRFIDTSNPPNGQDTSELRFSRSTDGGATYVNEQVIQAQGPSPFGCSVKVGPNGQVYVVWADRTGATQGDIRFRVSTDGGQNFGANVQVSTGNRQPGTDRVASCVNPNDRFTLNGNIRMLHQAWLAVDTTGSANNGNLYVVWASDPTGNTDNSDVLFSRSTNGGTTWSAALQLGGGTITDQFEPFVAVGGDEGTVSVAWYDRRNDAANNFNVDVFKAFSTDGGVTFGAIQRVTNQNWGVPQLNPNFDNAITNCYMGEYIAIAADAGRFYYLWGDNRNTITNVNWPAGRPDPDVFFETESAPDQPITATGTTINAVEGAPFSGVVATFTDPDTTATASEYGATINWGDGSPPTIGTISGPTGGPFTVSGSHTYITEGTFTITVVITDVDNPITTATAISTAIVADAPKTATCTNRVSSQLFAGVVASFTDANPFSTPADFSATIDWGDLTPPTPGAITTNTAGGFDVSGMHLYTSTGPFTVTTTINDPGGSPVSASCTFLIGAATAGGSFVVGDLNAAVGTSVTFWGAQWAKENSLSGGPAPSAFKGFASSPSSSPACGQTWSTEPGGSPGPPAPPLPAFIIVRVAASISKAGSTITGNTPQLVVVQVNTGYGSNPGHAGTGTVAGRLC
jgi:hypothetical protein